MSSSSSAAASSSTATTTASTPTPTTTMGEEPNVARLIPLPNNPKGTGAVTNLFPILAPTNSNGLLVPAVCHVSPKGSLATATSSSCPLASSGAWESLNSCVKSECKPRYSSNGDGNGNTRDDIAEISTEECAIRNCLDQFIASSANLCLPLSAPVLKDAQVYLPRLPPAVSNDTTFVFLHEKHLESVRQLPSSAPGSVPPVSGSLGICVSTVPVGTACDPVNDAIAVSAQASPWFLPAPANVPNPLPTNGQPIFPKAMLAYTKPTSSSPPSPLHSTDQIFMFTPDQVRPPVLLRSLLTESEPSVGAPSPNQPTPEKARVLSSTNFYSLTYCNPHSLTYQPTLAPNTSECTFNSQCRHSFSCMRGGQCAASAPPSLGPVAYLGNDAQDWLAEERRARMSQFTLQLIIVGVLTFTWCLHACHARLFRLWVRVNRKVKGTSTTTQRELALQPASNLMLEDLEEGSGGRAGRGWRGRERGMVDQELGIVVLDGVDALPQYQPPGVGDACHTLERDETGGTGVLSAGQVVLSMPPPAFTSVAPGASGPATLGESVDQERAGHVQPMEPSLAMAESVEGEAVVGPHVETGSLHASQASLRLSAGSNTAVV